MRRLTQRAAALQEFVVGIAPIVRGSLVEKLQCAWVPAGTWLRACRSSPPRPPAAPCVAVSFQLFDKGGTGAVDKDEMFTILNAMNKHVSYFGDDMMPEEGAHSRAPADACKQAH